MLCPAPPLAGLTQVSLWLMSKPGATEVSEHLPGEERGFWREMAARGAEAGDNQVSLEQQGARK